MTPRDESREATWLARAEHEAGCSGFAEHATSRLVAGAAAYADRWAELGLPRLLLELSEEAADLGSWGVLALQALERDGALDASTHVRLAARLERVIASGARAHRELGRAALELDRTARRRTFTPDLDGRCLNCGRTYGAHVRGQCHLHALELDATGAS
jgi:hypothetical protein